MICHCVKVLRTRLMELEIDQSKNGGIFLDDYGREQPMFNLSRELTDCLLTGCSAKMRMAVIKRAEDEIESLGVSKTFRHPQSGVEMRCKLSWISRYRFVNFST